MSLPLDRMVTLSQTCSTSLRRWLEKEDGAVPVAEAADEFADFKHTLRVEAVGGFVEDDEVGVAEEGVGEAEALLHAHRIGVELGAGAVGEAHLVEEAVDFVGGSALGDALEVGQVAASGEVGVEGGGLYDGADAAEGGFQVVGLAEEGEGAGGGREEAEEHAHSSGLAGAVGAEEAVDVAASDLDGEFVDGQDVAVAFGKSVGLDDVVGHLGWISRGT